MKVLDLKIEIYYFYILYEKNELLNQIRRLYSY